MRNLNGAGSMLIAGLEPPGYIYDIPLDGSQPTVELNTSNYLATLLGNWVGYVVTRTTICRSIPNPERNDAPTCSSASA